MTEIEKRPTFTVDRFDDRIPKVDYDKVVEYDTKMAAEQRSISRQLYHLTVWAEFATQKINEIELFLVKNQTALGDIHAGGGHNPLHPPADWPPR